MGAIRNSDGYRKNTSKDGKRSPHLSEEIANKMDVIARYRGMNFTSCVEEACQKYAKDYIESLDLVQRTELLELLWKLL